MRYYLGIDGGGTKTEFLLTDERGRVLARRVEKGSNPNDVGIEGAYRVFAEGLRAVCEAGKVKPRDVILFCGGSGCGVGSFAKELSARFEKLVARASFASDVANVVELGLSDEDGVVAIAGTGSAFAVQRKGEIQIVGGNGYLFEDYGSGYAIARAGFQAVLKVEDGFAPSTLLQAAFEEKLQGTVKKSLGSLYKGGKALIASFAPLVFESAEKGDADAKKILADNQNYMAGVLNELTKRYALRRIALAGGVFKNQAFTNAVKEKLSESVSLYIPFLPPVCGAAAKAAKSDGKFNESFMETLKGYVIEKGGVHT